MSRQVLDSISEQAIDWMVELNAGHHDATLPARLQHWLGQDPRHQQAWDLLQQRLGRPCAVLRGLDARTPGQAKPPANCCCNPPAAAATCCAAWLALGCWAAGCGPAGAVTPPWAGGPTCTASGQRRSFTLDDGSRLGLNSHSAVDLLFDADQRLLVLRRGELLIQVAPDPHRPLRVRTAQGQVQALGTRFLVSQERTQPAWWCCNTACAPASPMAASSTCRKARPPAAQQRYRTAGAGTTPARSLAARPPGGARRPLHQVIDALRDYQPGFIRLAPGVRDLRVQGVFPLDQPRGSAGTGRNPADPHRALRPVADLDRPGAS
jgi:transmembrane sensor